MILRAIMRLQVSQPQADHTSYDRNLTIANASTDVERGRPGGSAAVMACAGADLDRP
jgi:hypothetical protein